MKFAKYLAENSVPEWRSRYVNYRLLKKEIKKVLAARQDALHAGTEVPLASTEDEIVINTSPEGSSDDLVHARKPAYLRTRSNTVDSHLALTDDEGLRLLLEEANLAEADIHFFKVLDRELQKADRFYQIKEQEAEGKLEELRRQCVIMNHNEQIREEKRKTFIDPGDRDVFDDSPWELKETEEDPAIPLTSATDAEHFTPVVKNPRSRLQKAFLEYYRLLELLKNFRIINQTSMTKILKKNEKVTGNSGSIYISRTKDLPLFNSKKIEDLINQTENLFTETFADGNRHVAMRRLRVPDLKSQSLGFTTWRTGLYIGLSVPAILLTLRKTFVDGIPDPNVALILLIYGGFSIPIIFLFLYSLLLVIWARYHVNWVLVFELDPRDFLPPEGFSEFASLLLLLFSYNMYLALDDNILPFIPLKWYPVILFGTIMLIVFNPFKMYYRSSRKWFVNSMSRILLSGAFTVQFRDFFITDLLCSMTYMFVSMQILICSAFSEHNSLSEKCEFSKSWVVMFATAIPATWRLLQCIRRYRDNRLVHPHLTNAVKYCLSLSVIVLSAAAKITDETWTRVMWIICAIFASIYAYFWDVLFDWGLFQTNKHNKYLRKVIVYPSWWYMTAIGVNFVLRLSWVFLLSPNNWGFFHDARILVYFQALLELFRRFMWCIIRMENEHTNNIGKFRAVTEIPLPFRVNIIPHTDHLPVTNSSRRTEIPIDPSTTEN